MAQKVVFDDLEELSSSTAPPKIEKEEEPIKVEEVGAVKLVEVMPIRDFRYHYGGVQYFFTKGKAQKVPEEVKKVLLRSKQNPRIKDY